MDKATLKKVTGKLAPAGLGVFALAAFALTDLPWLGFGVTALALGYLWFNHRSEGLAKSLPDRALITAALMVWAVKSENGAGELINLLCGVLLLLVTLYEPLLREALNVGRLESRNLKVARSKREKFLAPKWPYLAHLGLLVLYAVSVAIGGTAWPVIAGLAVVAIVNFSAVLNAWRERRSSTHGHNGDQAVWDALEKHAPQFMVHYSAPAGTEYHVGMWLPYLEALKVPYMVVLRENRGIAAMARLTKAPVVVAPSMGQLEQVIVPSLKAAFYVNNGMKNVQSIRFSHLTHIQLLHGDSDKASSYNPVTAMFDKIYVAGQAGIDRYRDNNVLIPEEKFTIVGRPQVSEVEIVRTPIADVASPTVFYAPTWSGWFTDTNYCSLSIAEKILTGLIERGATIVFRPHPYTARNPASARQMARVEQLLAEDAAKTGRAHKWGKTTTKDMSLFECMNACDAMVSDVTAVASDWLYSEKPFAITDMLDEGERFHKSFPLSQAAYVVKSNASNVPDVLDRLLKLDPLADRRRDMKTYYLGDFPGTYVNGFLDAVRGDLLGKAGFAGNGSEVPQQHHAAAVLRDDEE
ncbi:CDP-glycerol glycerophosphotransferase family protein [Phytomonospora sp. NPDC050363]|uniref:CDP-glycerol glycerophosphotransferase family protein n=1 Tax=Phytomonospora sp. NPDC050363 TaxID=3155642 RepID=UPI003400E484